MQYKSLAVTLVAVTCVFNAAAQSNEELLEEMAATYPYHKVLSFMVTKKNYALTALYKSESDKKGVLYAAEVTSQKDGASIGFRIYRECEPTDMKGRLPVKIIVVSGQKIEAFAACGREGGGATSDVFVIRSEAGRDFVKQQFADKSLVFVRLDGVPVPFETVGFGPVWTGSSGKAL